MFAGSLRRVPCSDGTDIINNENWQAGYTGTMLQNGVDTPCPGEVADVRSALGLLTQAPALTHKLCLFFSFFGRKFGISGVWYVGLPRTFKL